MTGATRFEPFSFWRTSATYRVRVALIAIRRNGRCQSIGGCGWVTWRHMR
jgi:hypothetical protein